MNRKRHTLARGLSAMMDNRPTNPITNREVGLAIALAAAILIGLTEYTALLRAWENEIYLSEQINALHKTHLKK